MASHGGGSRASDEEIIGLMADADRLRMEAARAARDAEIAAQRAAEARMLLALRAMSRTDQEERDRLFALDRPLTPTVILDWAAAEAISTSRAQRRK